jgi:hypothetical protein
MSNHSEPKLIWTRIAGFLALFHGFWYTLDAEEISQYVLWFDGVVIGFWMIGGNGRAAIIDAIVALKRGKDD